MCTATFKKKKINKINKFHDVLALFCRIYGCSAVHNSPLEMFSTTTLTLYYLLLELDTHLFLYMFNLSTVHEPFPQKDRSVYTEK